MVIPFDVFFWRSLFVAALIAPLTIGAGLSWLVARIHAGGRLAQARTSPASGANARISG